MRVRDVVGGNRLGRMLTLAHGFTGLGLIPRAPHLRRDGTLEENNVSLERE